MLLLSRNDIASLLTLDDYIQVVEQAFRKHAEGGSFLPAIAHVDAHGGEFHIKAGGLHGTPPYFGAKVNGGFFQNRARHGLPNIQGLIILSRADNGVPLAVLDSIEITIQRTGASTAIAARYLARQDSRVCTICGCGNQARIQLRALSRVFQFERVYVWSPIDDAAEADAYAREISRDLGLVAIPVKDLSESLAQSDVCVTCSPSRAPYVRRAHVRPGTFIAAVGADSPDKQELDSDLTAQSKVVADIRDQAIAVGETHHAIAAGLVSADHVYADLGEIITGKKPGRTSAEEIIIFDSTGTALQDVAAAAAVYERAISAGRGTQWEPG